MDGSVVIGVRLDEEQFLSALSQLQVAANQTATRALAGMAQRLAQVNSAFSQGAGVARSWAGQVTTGLRNVVSSATAVAPALGNAGRTSGQMFVSGLLAADTFGAGRRLGYSAVSGFSAGDYYGAGSRAAWSLVSGFSSGQGGLYSAGSSMAYSVKSAFYGGWYSVGYQITAGIATGIWSGSSLITSAAVSAAYSALSAAKRALSIRSPSRVFREEVGRMIPEGMAKGIRDGSPAIKSALHQTSEQVVRTARQDVLPAVNRLGSRSQPGTRESGGMKITVEAPIAVDGRELARATARYTSRQIEWEAIR